MPIKDTNKQAEFDNLHIKLKNAENLLSSTKKELQQKQDILDAHNRILEFSYESNLHDLLKKSLDEIEILTKSNIAFFHFIDEDEINISLQVWSTNTERNMCNAQNSDIHYTIDDAGIWADSIRKRKTVIHNDFINEKNKKGFPEGHSLIVRELVVPIFRQNKIVAVLGVGNKSSDYSEDDAKVLQQVADFTWEIAIQKKYNMEIELANKKWQKTFNNINDSIFLLNSEGIIIQANKSSESFFDSSINELVGKHCSKVLKCIQNESPDCNFDKVKRSRKREIQINKVNDKSLEITLDPIFDSNSNFQGAIHILSDITERVLSEEALKSFSAIQVVILEIAQLSVKENNMTDFLSEVHQKIKKIIRADNFYIAIYNHNNDTYHFAYHVDEFDEVEIGKEYHLQGGYTDYVRKEGKGQLFLGKTKDGSNDDTEVIGYGANPSVWLGVPLRLSDNELYGVLSVQDYHNFQAYTEVELNTLEIIAQNIGVFIERVNTFNELQKAKENAEESDKLKSAFLANMSHEIRTPMNGILGFTEILKEPDLSNEEQEEYIEVIERNGNRMLALISNLIDISKIESGQMPVIINPTDINEQIDNIYTFFNPEVLKKGLVLEKHQVTNHKPFIINTDQEKLYAILANLVKNAIKYSGKGKICIGYINEKDFVKFYVKDTGVGIPEDKQKSIFDRFIQGDSSHSNPYEGAGLGLAICKAYVDLLNGDIWVESKVNEGAQFYFTLPK